MEPSTSAFLDDGSSSITDCSELELSECMHDMDEYAESLEAYEEPQIEEEELALEGNDDRQELDSGSADDLLMHCFFACLKFATSKIELPILITNFYKNHILEQCPADQRLNIAKTSYRNLFDFFDCTVDLGMITMIKLKPKIYHYDHPCLREFTLNPAYEPPKEKPKPVNRKPHFSIAVSHSVTAAVVPIFTQFGYSKEDTIANSEIRRLVEAHIEEHNLQDAKNKDMVNVDPSLKTIFGLNPHLSCKFLFTKVYKSMTPYYEITYGDKVFIRRGKLPTIDISIGKCSGNKKVTLVDNIEVHGIDLNEMLTRSSKKGGQLQIRGNQIDYIYNLLTDVYNIPKRFVKGLELAPKQK